MMKIKIRHTISLLIFVVLAISPTYAQDAQDINAFGEYKDIEPISIIVPTVVEVPFEDEVLERYNFAIFNKNTNSYEPYYFRTDSTKNEIPISTEALGVNSFSARKMVDGNIQTYTNFDLPEDGETNGKTTITLRSAKSITSSSLSVLLDNNVALPNTIKVTVGNNDKIVIATKRLSSQRINFPRTTANVWNITLTYSQPLRISELRLNQENAGQKISRGLRFLAQPDTSYRIYFNSDRFVSIATGEIPNLVSDEGVLSINSVLSQSNPEYIEADIDSDGVPDRIDNCVRIPNSDQVDINQNNRGDACDDFDKDGVINSKDNCINDPNRNQADIDNDNIGDICDGEESRLTEKYPWLPWVGLGTAGVVMATLFVVVAKSTFGKKTKENSSKDEENKDSGVEIPKP